MLYTQFTDELDTNALQLVWDAWRGQAVGKAGAGLAAINVVSYVAGKYLGQPAPTGPVFGVALLNETAVDQAFEAAIAEHKAGTLKTAAAIPWAILLQVALELIGRLFPK